MINPKKPLTQTLKIGKPKILRPNFSAVSSSHTIGNRQSLSPNKTNAKLNMNTSKKSNTGIVKATGYTKIDNFQPEKKTQPNSLFFPVLPMLITAKAQDVKSLFIEKCKQCYQICDFSRSITNAYVIAKDDVLNELCSVLKENFPQIPVDIETCSTIFSLLAKHVFREPKALPHEWYSIFDYYMLTDHECLDSIHPREWSHISIVYDIAINFIKLPQFNQDVCLHLCGDLIKLSVYESRTCDDREQSKLSTLFLALYQKITKLRKFALDVSQFSLSRIIYEGEPFTSAKPLLSSLSRIIAGFHEPLKPQNVQLFHDIILPLHRNSYIAYFAKELFTCVVQFLEHDHSLVLDLLKVLIRDWPRLNPQKQILFIDEIALLSSFVENSFLTDVIRLITPQLMISLMGCHAAISEKVLSMWEVNDFVWLMTVEPSISYPLLIPTIYEVGLSYWNLEIRLIASAVLAIMNANNRQIFEATGKNLKKLKSVTIMNGLTRAAKWKYLIITYENDPKLKRNKLSRLSRLFDGCEAIDPYSPSP